MPAAVRWIGDASSEPVPLRRCRGADTGVRPRRADTQVRPYSPLRLFAAWAAASGSVRHVATVKFPGIRVNRDVVTLTASEGGRCTFTERQRSCERTPVRVPAAARQPCRTEPSRLLPLRRFCRGPFTTRPTFGSSANKRGQRGLAGPIAAFGTANRSGGAHRVVKVPRRFSPASDFSSCRVAGTRNAYRHVAADKNVCPTASSAPGAYPRPHIRSWVFGALPAQTCR